MLWLELLLKITLYSISGVMHYVISYYAKTYCKSAVSMLLCERANVSSQADDTLGQNILALSRRLIYIIYKYMKFRHKNRFKIRLYYFLLNLKLSTGHIR